MTQWQLEGGAAELYERHLVPTVTARWATDLVERVNLGRGERALDIACGTGVVARAAAERVGRAGYVAGIDVNTEMVAVALASQAGFGREIGWFQGSAEALPFSGASFDAALCQFGLMFVPDRQAAVAEMYRVLVPGGHVGISVFGPIENNPATFALAQALDRRAGPGASLTKRSEHVLADVTALRTLAGDAGFQQIAIVTQTRIIRLGSAPDYVRIQMSATPLAAQLRAMPARSARRLVKAIGTDVAESLRAYETDGGLAYPQEAHVLVAEK
jgi:ubiquinone/menaquinone biosynthesis C-methylase UbiE